MSTNYLVSYGTYYSYLADLAGKQTGLKYIIPTANCEIKTFNNDELSVKFNQSLRGKHLFIFAEVVHHMNELLMTIDAARRCSVDKMTVVMPYYGFSRQDKREGNRGCIGASAIANVLQRMGVDRIVSIDLHAAQIQGMVQIPFEHLSGINIFKSILRDPSQTWAWDSFVFVSPDAGGILRVQKFADFFNVHRMAMIDKRRAGAGVVSSMELIGSVEGMNAILIDDMGDTCSTMIKASDLLLSKGAIKTYGLFTHPILTNGAAEKLENSSFTQILMSDTVNPYTKVSDNNKKITILTCADLLNEAIHLIANDLSISHLN